MCETSILNTNITNNSNCNWRIVSTYLHKNLSSITKLKSSMWQGGKILKLGMKK